MATHGVFGFPGTAPPLHPLQTPGRQVSGPDRKNFLVPGGLELRGGVSWGHSQRFFFFARPHFGNGLVLPGPRTLSSSQSTPHPRPQPPPLLSGSMLITQLLPQAFRLAQGSQSHTRATRSVLQGQPGRSRLGQMPGGSYGKEESSWTAMLQLPAGKTSSPPQLRSPNRSAPARLQPGVTFQQ